MITALDHIAIAVPDLEAAIARFSQDFGLELKGIEDVTSAQTKTAFFPLPETQIELLHPLDGKGPIAKFLQRRSGLHHLCFRSDNIYADIERLKSKGYQFITDQPQPGAHGSLTIFIHPKSCDGVLVEISQPALKSD